MLAAASGRPIVKPASAKPGNGPGMTGGQERWRKSRLRALDRPQGGGGAGAGDQFAIHVAQFTLQEGD